MYRRRSTAESRDPHGEAALGLRDEVRGLDGVEGSGADEQDVVRLHVAVLRAHLGEAGHVDGTLKVCEAVLEDSGCPMSLTLS